VAEPWAAARNLLVMRLDNIGDVVMTGPALRALKQNLPAARLTLMASPGGSQAAPLLPWVDDVLTWRAVWQDLGHLPFDPEREWSLIAALRERAFDALIVLTSFSQSPHPAGLIAALAGIPLRAGESKERGDGGLTHVKPSAADEIHQVERNLGLLEWLGFGVGDRRLALSIPAGVATSAAALLARHGVRPGAPTILLCPWASCPARTYFPDRFATAAGLLSVQTGWPVVVAGSARDVERTAPLIPLIGPQAIDLSGQTSVPEMAALVQNARLVLTNDSLPMHLADALGSPSVVMYSGTEYESQWQPRHSPHRLLRRPTPCSPCYAFHCPYNLECLDFSAEEVAAAGLALLGAG
jgi:ADP-heptose:LPS heptosyltransferase